MITLQVTQRVKTETCTVVYFICGACDRYSYDSCSIKELKENVCYISCNNCGEEYTLPSWALRKSEED